METKLRSHWQYYHVQLNHGYFAFKWNRNGGTPARSRERIVKKITKSISSDNYLICIYFHKLKIKLISDSKVIIKKIEL